MTLNLADLAEIIAINLRDMRADLVAGKLTTDMFYYHVRYIAELISSRPKEFLRGINHPKPKRKPRWTFPIDEQNGENLMTKPLYELIAKTLRDMKEDLLKGDLTTDMFDYHAQYIADLIADHALDHRGIPRRRNILSPPKNNP